MSDTGHVIWKSSHALFLSLIILFSLPATTFAFNVSYSAPTQCGPFQIIWDDSVSSSSLFILPFNDHPVNVDSLSVVHDTQTKTYNYTLNKLPLKTGAQFIVAMDYSFDATTVGVYVSLIQTVGDSSDSSCVSTDSASMSSFFSLNPPVPSACSTQTVSWNAARYQVPPNIRVFIPGGQAFNVDRPTSNARTFTTWIVSIRERTQAVLLAQPFNVTQADIDSRTSPLLTITPGSDGHGEDCLSSREFRSTVTLSSTTATPASTITAAITEPTNNNNVSTPAIIGGVLGGLACIAIICAAIVFYRLSKRKRKHEISAFENSTVPTEFTGGFVDATSIRKRPLNAQERPPLLERPSRNLPVSMKRSLLSPPSDVEQSVSSTRSSGSLPAFVAPAQPTPVRTETSHVTSPSASTDPTATDDEDDDEDHLVGGPEGVIGTQYVRHTDAGEVGVADLPPSYNEG